MQDDFIVGLEDEAKEISHRIMEDEPRRFVVSIVGMGGGGKTTLARKVYNLDNVRRSFDCHAWVYISAAYQVKDVLQRIMESFKKPSKDELNVMQSLNEEGLEDHLHEFLEKRRYLVIIDDVWHTEAWTSLKRALPDSNNGSRVILTTRNLNVAPAENEGNHVHKLRFLDEEEGWEPLRRKAFPTNCGCSPNLEYLGREMVKNCGGLPLAIIVLGGLLFTKSPEEWQTVHACVCSQLMEDQQYQLSAILALSYRDLPYQLKTCFLYLGIFPEDYEIETRKLIRLWIAEGFIPQYNRRMEDVGEGYLNELINRSMIQVARRSWTKRISRCRIHDLLRDLSISKAKVEGLFVVYKGNTNSPFLSSESRRHAAHSQITRYFSLNHMNPHLRSLLLFNPDQKLLHSYHWKSLYLNFKVLRVLELNNINLVPQLPNEIGNLIYLRYLGIVGTKSFWPLPMSICNLVMLQILDLSKSDFGTLPDVIWKMKKLRFIRAKIHEPLRLDTLEEIHCLKEIDAAIWIECCSLNLNSLCKLKIVRILSSHGEVIFDSIAKHSSSLQSLSLMTEGYEHSFPALLPLSYCCNLYKIRLNGKIERLPKSQEEFPPKLTTLILIRSKIEQDPMPILSKPPNLTHLSLDEDSYNGRNMTCSGQGFPHLQFLLLRCLYKLEEWAVEEGAMPHLRFLHICGCTNLMMVPEGLRFVSTLEKLVLRNMRQQFLRRIKQEDRQKVEHIPFISSG